MSDSFLLNDISLPLREWIPTASLPANIDAGLLHTALERWRHASAGLRELFAGVPSTLLALSASLERQLDLGEPDIGLRFSASEQYTEQFIGLAQAWVFVYKHPDLATALDRPCTITGLDSKHPLASLTPLQLLTRLHTLDPHQALDQAWNTHWDGRAPGTPLSRRERASQLYRIHLEATAHVALAQRTVTADQLRPLWLLLDDASSSPQLNGQPVRAERVDLLLSNNTRVTLPDAWVISVGDRQSGAQLFYLPKQAVALQAFAKRADLQAWLGRQGLVPKGLPASDLRFEYSPRALPLTQGMSDLLSHWQQARLTALRSGTQSRPGLAEHGAQVLDQANQLDRQLSVGGVFAMPPLQSSPLAETADDEPLWFGALHADIPWPVRKAAVARQREALENWSMDAREEQRQALEKLFQTLETAEADADSAAYKLLYRERALDLVTLNREFTALHAAHKKALLAEAELQHTLKQLSDDEHLALKTLLQPPGGSEPAREGANTTAEEITTNLCAASLSLSMTERTTTTRAALNGPWIITEIAALNDPESPHSLLLIWPGAGGGVQRFANRSALEREVFKRHEQDAVLALQLVQISGDPLHHALHEVTFEFDEQVAALRQRYSEPAQAAQLAEQLETLRQRFRATLQVPVSGARQLALAHLQEQSRSATLADNLPDWLRNLSLSERSTLKQLIEQYIGAMQRSHALMEIALPPREQFTRQHLHERLRKDFSLKGEFEVQLDLPDSVAMEKHTIPAPGAPGTPVKLELLPSKTRSKLSLLELAQQNIDNTPSMSLEPMQLRLGFMRVEATASSEAERQTLVRGITKPYLNRVLPELDLPKAYETLIRQVFMGSRDDPPFVNEHRRECLLEPWGLMLRLQGEYARLQQHISADEQRIFDAAIDGQSADATSIVLLPATLNSGGKDTPNEGPVTLAGVTFIQQSSSGITLLYLPDSPDGQFLRRYPSLEDARIGLFNQCAQEKWASYLAGRALLGNVRAHEVRIGQASEKRFNALIGVGTRWPATTSLAAHLLNVHMGRLIEAHRGTSRSNDALYLERYALDGPRAFNYLKMALGMVPFVGTAIALYDAWTSANQAAAAFLRGRVGDGVAELEAVLLCLIDAAMDILPSVGVGSPRPPTRQPDVSAHAVSARTLTRNRQLDALAFNPVRHPPETRPLPKHRGKHSEARFEGYQYLQHLNLAGIQPGHAGVYRNIYRHPDGDFIFRQGRVYQVEPSTDSRGWRLSGTAQKTYKQPIALDANGEWDTHFAVHGTTFDGGGAGGGNVLGQMADVLDPLWPLAIRERLPRWWVDREFRRLYQLTSAAQALTVEMQERFPRSKVILDHYYGASAYDRYRLGPAAEIVCKGDIELTERRYAALVELIPLRHGNNRRLLNKDLSKDAGKVADRLEFLVHLHNNNLRQRIYQINGLLNELRQLPGSAFRKQVNLLLTMRQLRLENLKSIETIEILMRDLNRWYERIIDPADKALFSQQLNVLNGRMSEGNLLYVKANHMLENIHRHEDMSDASWLFFHRQADEMSLRTHRAMDSQHGLSEAVMTATQRNQVLQNCLDTYQSFLRDIRVWATTYPQHLRLDEIPQLQAVIEELAENARTARLLPHTRQTGGTITKKTFTTEDGATLIGVESWEPTTQVRQFQLTGKGGVTEVWEQNTNGRFRLLNPPVQSNEPTSADLDNLLAEARKRLNSVPTYETKVNAYAEQDMLPVDLEHMLVSEADELTHRAERLEKLDAEPALIKSLRDSAAQLKTRGRQMRTEQSLRSKKPTDGMLVDLLEQKVVEIRKVKDKVDLGKRRDGRRDFMQEYEIHDLTKTPSTLLWYAHFHYNKATQGFREFEKGHLKLPEHRLMTHADDPSLPHADIGRQSTTLAHFENL